MNQIKIAHKRLLYSAALSRQTQAASKKSWNDAVAKAEILVHQKGSMLNPRQVLGKDFDLITDNIKKLLGTRHPMLKTISGYYLQKRGKHIRPLIVLLMAQATTAFQKDGYTPSVVDINSPISPTCNIKFPDQNLDILSSQKRLAEIVEMIHAASLLHDDVIDKSDLRRNQASANVEFGNKMAILGGDFLLARASVALARLQNVQVVELIATIISNLVEGEFMQLKNNVKTSFFSLESRMDKYFEYYLEKTYLKTASLIAQSCRATALLGNCTEKVAMDAYEYGKNVGMAFQLIDDMLDFVVSSDEFGKPVNADLKLGLATAPVLFATDKYPELWKMVDTGFTAPGDIEKALLMVLDSQGLAKTKELAIEYSDKAIAALSEFPESPAKQALQDLTKSVIDRTK